MLNGISLQGSIEENWMRYYKAKNAEHQGLRFSISFLQVKNELAANVQLFEHILKKVKKYSKK